MKISIYRFKFYLIILFELLFLPYFFFRNWYKWNFGIHIPLKMHRVRESVYVDKISVCIHEWGGFEATRTKKVKKIPKFLCGLSFQLRRFKEYRGQYNLDLTITLSDSQLLSYDINHSKIIKVSNCGMDFSGYSNFYNSLADQPNQYVILTNTSVNSFECEFIDGYIDFFRNDRTIGLLGISYSSKMSQSLIYNNFTPHLQSFFVLTTLHVLKEIVEFNSGFPGSKVDFKLQLIREGEIRLSQIALKLGYNLVSILEDGTPFYFDSSCMLDNGRSSFNSFFGDYRLNVKNPNSINQINI